MTVGELIRVLRQYEREHGTDVFVTLADADYIIGDAVAVGYDDKVGDIIISAE